MSSTSPLISVESAIAMSFVMRFLLCVAHRFTYSARIAPVGGVFCVWRTPPAGSAALLSAGMTPAADREEPDAESPQEMTHAATAVNRKVGSLSRMANSKVCGVGRAVY